MPRKSSKPATTLNSTSHLFRRSGKAKDLSRSMTSETIATDVAAFRKQGGHIEVLGITPLRPRSTAFSSKGNTQRKTAAEAATDKVAARR